MFMRCSSGLKSVCAALLLSACNDVGGPERAMDVVLEDASANAEDSGDAGAQEHDGGSSQSDGAALVPASDADVQDAAPSADAGDQAQVDAGWQPCATTLYRDADHDGFGDPNVTLASCSTPDGYVGNANDCYDANDKAKPGQAGRFKEHRGDGSFDYDCDGAQRPLKDKVAQLPVFTGAECPIPPAQLPGETCDYAAQSRVWQALMDGWFQTVAACGAQAPYGPGYKIAWNDSTRTFGYVDLGLPSTSIQTCN